MSDKQQGSLYHLILGLPAETRSPNHYELLGLDHRTSDPAIINTAAADQNRKLLYWQNSDRYAEVRELTLEVVQARSVLLDEASRTAYDQTLGEWGLISEGPWVLEEPPPPKDPAEPLSVRCPECEASFKLRNRELLGRRMPCPECGFRFTIRQEPETLVEVVQLYEEDSAGEAELAALDNFDEMDEPTPRPRSRPRPRQHIPSRRKSSRRSQLGSQNRWAAVLGGVLMSLGIVVLAGMFLMRSLSASTAIADQLAYLPTDCRAVGYYRMGDVSRSPFFQEHLARSVPLRNSVDQFRERTGMELQDLESIAIGLKENGFTRFQSLGITRNPRGLRFTAVVRRERLEPFAIDWRAFGIGFAQQPNLSSVFARHQFLRALGDVSARCPHPGVRQPG